MGWTMELSRSEIILFSETYSISHLIGTRECVSWGDHAPPSCVKVKNARSYTSIHTNAFMAWCIIKLRDKFTSVGFRKPVGLYITEAEGQIGRSSKREEKIEEKCFDDDDDEEEDNSLCVLLSSTSVLHISSSFLTI